MKRFIILLTLLVLCIAPLKAQRCLPKMKGIELKGGFVDAIRKPYDFYGGASFFIYAQGASRWVFSIEYLSKKYSYRDIFIPKAQFTMEGGYYFKILSDPSKTLFLNIGASALAGYETSNWGKKKLYDGSTLCNDDAFVYGGAISMELETFISDNIVVAFIVRERILWGSSIGKFHTQFGIGLKFILN